MTPQRWAEISELYAAVLDVEADARDAVLAARCEQDPDLRREVESLLSQQADASVVSRLVSTLVPGRATGARLGAYRLEALIGEGGMGEVYRAHDEALARDAAIKILPAAFAADPNRRARFEREARVLASLNHPNIAAIHGVVEGDGRRGLVLELVDGETLAERLKRPPRLTMPEIVAIARQLVEALDAAHGRGIVHRDFKPANITITPEGQVKVLDFGLAKAIEKDDAPFGSVPADMPASQQTGEGVVVGTVCYMSPEQARGLPVDRRTDIWAFGCVLYEMLTGAQPFRGDTMSDVVVAILERDPDWDALPHAPPQLLRLVRRCLEKDTRARLRDIGDAFGDPGGEAAASLAQDVQLPAVDRRSPRVAWSVAALLAATIVGGVAWLSTRREDVTPVFKSAIRLTRGPALEFGPAISPDGKWVAYLSNERGPTDIWVRYVSGGDATNLTADSGLQMPTRIDIGGLAISPDGTRIAFDAGSRPGTPSNLFDAWTIPAPLGGTATKLVERGRALRWSPDGRRIVYVRAGASAGDALFVADADGTNERPVVAARGMHMHWPSWSPDGRSLYFIQTPQTSNAEPVEIHRVSADGGPVETVVATARRAIFPIPTNDGRGLLYAANPFTAELGLWWKPLRADATPRQVTSGVGEYQDLAVSAGTGDAVASIVELRQSIVAIDTDPHAGGASREITDGSSGDLDPVLSPQNDRLVFSSIRSGNRQLWSAEPDGQRPRRLTTGDSLDEQATISPDGRRTAFVSDRGGRRGLWVMNADGGVPRLLVHALVVDVPSWSPDGQELVYTTPIADAPGLWVVEVETSTVRRLATPGPARAPVWHPSADLIAYIEARRPEAGQPNSSRVAFVNRRGEPQHPGLTESPNLSNGFLAWSPDARSLAALIEPGSTPSAVWILDPSGVAPPRSVGAFPIGVRLRGATWTPDGRTLLVGRSQQSSDIVFFQR